MNEKIRDVDENSGWVACIVASNRDSSAKFHANELSKCVGQLQRQTIKKSNEPRQQREEDRRGSPGVAVCL